MPNEIELPQIPEQEQTPLVRDLVGIIEQLAEKVRQQEELIGQLQDEIAVLKGEKKRPTFKSSGMDKKTDTKDQDQGSDPQNKRKRPGSAKRHKTQQLRIHEDKKIPPEHVPEGSRFKGYQDWVVQELVIGTHNTRYRLERWLSPEGEELIGQLPDALKGQHFGPMLRGYILYQYHHAHVTRPVLQEQLQEWGIDISSGQIERILNQAHERFHAEKQAILAAGLEVSSAVTVDDTSARHQGRNGYTTQIGSAYFAWFESTGHKDRINFLKLLNPGPSSYVIDDQALAYMREQKLPNGPWRRLRNAPVKTWADAEHWQESLEELGITKARHQRIATEGALLAGLLQNGVPEQLAIVSDDAGQFNILNHGLCWVHAERLVHKLIPLNEPHREDQAAIRKRIWDLYAELKQYKLAPNDDWKSQLEARFDALFTTKTRFETLNRMLKRLHRNKSELLLVLERPEVPLHTNASEQDIRDYVKKRKISGGTRSDLGRRCRDTFATCKKTCRKLGVSFWEYLIDRLSGTRRISPLPSLIRQMAAAQ